VVTIVEEDGVRRSKVFGAAFGGEEFVDNGSFQYAGGEPG